MAINITGTNGNDLLNNNPADPAASVNVTGLGGNDTILGSTNADTLFGNLGNDTVRGNGGSDTIYGGQDNDRLAVTGNRPTTTEPALNVRSLVVGGLGRDTITASNDLFGALNPTGNFIGQVTIYGGNQGSDPVDDADLITVSLGLNSSADIYGNGGDDVIVLDAAARSAAAQTAANFYVNGGQGNDFIFGSVGTESEIFGGLGSDTILSAATDTVTISGGNGNNDAADGSDIIAVTLGRDGVSSPSLVPTADLFGNGGNDVIQLNTGPTTAVLAKIYGGRGGDDIDVNGKGLASNSYVAGGLGADTIDVNVSGTAVTIVGGNGTEDPADGQDRITVNLADDSSASVFGNGGDDIITINGQGNVTVFGGAGGDTFNVGPSAATASSVVLTGGLGPDRYNINVDAVASANAPIVRVTDFNFDEDRIAGNPVNLLRTVDQAVSSLAELKTIAAVEATPTTAVLINVQSGEFAGTYLGYSNGGADELINITGYTGTADTDIFV